MGKKKENVVIEDEDEIALNEALEAKEQELNKKLDEDIDGEEEGEEEEEEGGCCGACHGGCHKKKKGKDGKKKKKGKSIPDSIKIIGLAGLIPLVFFLPKLLVKVCIMMDKFPKYTLHSIWGVYALLEFIAIFVVHKGRMTLDSVVTQQSIYLLFAMGSYNFLHIANSVHPMYRATALRVWLTLTNSINVIVLFLDNTNYARKERKEKERAKRREEKRKAADEEYRRIKAEKDEVNPPWYKRNARIKFISDAIVYLVLLVIVLVIGKAFMNYKAEFDKGFAEKENTWGYEGNTGADYQGTTVEDYELDEATVKTATEQPTENVEL